MKALVGVFLAISAIAQTVSAPAFEVASVKASVEPGKFSTEYKNGRMTIANASLSILICGAYRVTPNRIRSGPNWLEDDRFEVAAKTDPATSQDDARLMLRTLLAERFQLKAHQEQKLLDSYTLTVAKGGIKMEAVPGDSPVKAGCPSKLPFTCTNLRMADLASMLSNVAAPDIDRPVIDETGLAGNYNFKLSWTAMSNRPAPGPTIFEALQEQLGLKLQPGKHTVEYLVIDHVERKPIEN
jgi:uncharacterized protein (TIGR03435 family)